MISLAASTAARRFAAARTVAPRLAATTTVCLQPVRSFSSVLIGSSTPATLARRSVPSASSTAVVPSISSVLAVSPATSPAAMGSISTNMMSVRWRTRGTEYQPSNLKRKRRHGFLRRLRSASGRKILIRRKLKGRRFLSH